MKQSFKKFIYKSFIFFLIFLQFSNFSFAIEGIITRESVKVDEKLAEVQLAEYRQPRKILITQISTKATDLTYDSEVWYSQIYYYYITRLGFVDIPFNYLVSENGEIYQGRKGYVGILPELQEPEGVVLIGYLSNNSSITRMAEASLLKLINSIKDGYSIKKENIAGTLISINKSSVNTTSSENQQQITPSKIVLVDDKESIFYKNIDRLIAQNIIAESSSLDERSFKISITSNSYKDIVKSGEKIDVVLKIKNDSDLPIFFDGTPLFIRTLDSKKSPYYINGTWNSDSVPVVIDEDVLLPQEGREISFSLDAGIMPTEEEKLNQQSFIIATKIDEKEKIVEGGEFIISFSVEKGDFDIVKIADTGVGYINVRACPDRGCDKILAIPVGEKVIVKEYGDGWTKVIYEEKEGWIVSSYTTKVN